MVFKNISAIYSLLLPALQFEPGHYTLILRHMNSNHEIIFSDCNSLMLCLSHPLTPTDVILSQIHIDTCYCKSQAAPVCPHLSSYLWLAITKICLSFLHARNDVTRHCDCQKMAKPHSHIPQNNRAFTEKPQETGTMPGT